MTPPNEDGLYLKVSEQDIKTLNAYAAFLSSRTGLVIGRGKALEHVFAHLRVELASDPIPAPVEKSLLDEEW